MVLIGGGIGRRSGILALAMEGMGRFDLAVSIWKLYLRSALKAADAQQVQSKIWELEYKVEQARKQN